ETMPAEQAPQFRELCRRITAIYHFEYHKKLEELKSEYAPFNPDAVECPLNEFSPEDRQENKQKLYERFAWLLERANFKRLSKADIQAATTGASAWGVNLDTDLSVFEHLEIFVRGDGLGKRNLRRWPYIWRLREVTVPIYRRLVVLLKQTKHARLGK